MKKAVVAESVVIVILALGGATLGGLIVGDAQAQKYINAGVCDSEHYVTTYIPRITKESGDVQRVKFSLPCDQWMNGFTLRPQPY